MFRRFAHLAVAVLILGLGSSGVGTVSNAGSADAAPAAAGQGRRYIDQIFPTVEVAHDVTYASAPSLNDATIETLLMDVYEPAGDTATTRPVIVFIHGGGFKAGDRSSLADEATAYARRGFVTASINYRLDTDNECQALQDGTLPPGEVVAAAIACQVAVRSAQHDAQAAVRYIRAHAGALGVDPSRVATIGFSAGAVTATNLAYRSHDPGTVGDFDAFDSKVQAAISASGCQYDAASIGAGDAPTFFLHAEFDAAVPFSCAVANADAARAAGLPVETMFFYGEPTHARNLYRAYQSDVDARWTAFLGRHLGVDGIVPAGAQTVIHGLPNRSAVVSIVTTANEAPGFVQVLPCDSTPGTSSNLNTDRSGQTRAGLAIVRFDAAGEACLYNQSMTHLVADLQGYFINGAIDDVVDTRLADSRVTVAGGAAPPLAPRSQTELTGRPNSTAIVSLVVTDTAAAGYVQLLRCGTAPGSSSNVNADRAGQTIANLAFVDFDATGRSCVFNQSSAHIVVDLQAYLNVGTFDDITDTRVLDTRTSGAKPAAGAETQALARADSTAVVSLVATAADGPGFVQALACGSTAGASSNVNVDEPGQTIANLAFVDVSAAGTFCLYNQTPTDLVADVQGYLLPGSFDDITDVRLLDTRLP